MEGTQLYLEKGSQTYVFRCTFGDEEALCREIVHQGESPYSAITGFDSVCLCTALSSDGLEDGLD